MALLKKELPSAKIIAMDILPDHVDIVEFVKAGGSGFILKNATIEDYIETITSVMKGNKVLPSILTRSLFTQIIELTLNNDENLLHDSFQLTQREREVVDLISKGMSNKEIAEALHIATFTVKSHVHNILEKLSLSTRLEIVVLISKQKNQML